MSTSTAATTVASAADMSAKMALVRRGKERQVVDVTLKAGDAPPPMARKRLCLPSLTTPRNARRAYARTISWILDNKIDTARAYAIAALLNGVVKSLEVEALASLEVQVKAVGQQQAAPSYDTGQVTADGEPK